jgi:putative nucleotidyltransferase with HDIG domain
MMLARTDGIAHIGSWEWDIATDTVTWSDELFRIFQRDRQEGAPSFAEHPALYHPDDMARLQQAVEAAIADGTPYELELRAFRKDGETRLCVARGVAEMAPGGRPVHLFGSLQDITERKLVEEKLAKSYESLKKTLNDAINTMVKIVETRDPYTSGHQQKVAGLAIAIAREMKLEDARIDNLRTAAIIHDIGKMNVPSDILSRPGKLSDMEFSLIKTHAQGGYDIVKSMDFPCNVAKTVLQHHERLDGSGYPNHLKSEDTLLEAKILAVADVVEAMASHRPYRPALGIDKALEEISKNRGKLYDPDVADTCLELFNSGRFEFKAV